MRSVTLLPLLLLMSAALDGRTFAQELPPVQPNRRLPSKETSPQQHQTSYPKNADVIKPSCIYLKGCPKSGTSWIGTLLWYMIEAHCRKLIKSSRQAQAVCGQHGVSPVKFKNAPPFRWPDASASTPTKEFGRCDKMTGGKHGGIDNINSGQIHAGSFVFIFRDPRDVVISMYYWNLQVRVCGVCSSRRHARAYARIGVS